jgi:siroheme synthase-like protein
MSWSYPIFVDLRGRRAVVIGCGFATLEKVRGLVEAGAEVTLVAADASAELRALAAGGTIRHVPRDYRPGDLEGAFLAISTHDDRSRNEGPWREAIERNILFNAVDDPLHCRFTFPSVLRHGDLAVAISTNGRCPAVAVRLKQELEGAIRPEYAAAVEALGAMRDEIAAAVPDFDRRKRLWYRLVDSCLASGAQGADMRSLAAREIEKERRS